MYDKKAEKRAAELGILDKMQALERDLLTIEGVSDIDFDIDNYDELYQVVLIPRYDAGPLDESYYVRRLQILGNIMGVCFVNDLHPTYDRIEDYGEHWHIVREPGSTWPRVVKHENP